MVCFPEITAFGSLHGETIIQRLAHSLGESFFSCFLPEQQQFSGRQHTNIQCGVSCQTHWFQVFSGNDEIIFDIMSAIRVKGEGAILGLERE